MKQERLQQKYKQGINQQEKLEQLKSTIWNTDEEIEQLEYILIVMEHITDTNRAPWVIPNRKLSETFDYISQVYDYLQHRYKQCFKYELVYEILFIRYKFRSRSKTPERECFSFATVLTYFKRARGMVNAED